MNAPINGEEGPPTAAAAAAQAANHAAAVTNTAPPPILETPRRDTNRVTSPLPVDASPRWKHDIEEQLVTVSNQRKRLRASKLLLSHSSFFVSTHFTLSLDPPKSTGGAREAPARPSYCQWIAQPLPHAAAHFSRGRGDLRASPPIPARELHRWQRRQQRRRRPEQPECFSFSACELAAPPVDGSCCSHYAKPYGKHGSCRCFFSCSINVSSNATSSSHRHSSS